MGKPAVALERRCAQVLGPDSDLAAVLPGFQPRQAQLEMAEAVATTLNEGGTLVCEAGTGTGKTYAYLAPALLSGRKVIVSTGTKALQDQLYHRDLPLLCQGLGWSPRHALLKGRANYLCHHRLGIFEEEGRLPRRDQISDLAKIRDWALRTLSGDIAELAELPEDSPLWPRVTSTTDNCLGQECPELDRCHVREARRSAQEADLVVVNHHLLCAHLALRADGFGALLPDADLCIVDEAHQLADIAASYFGVTLSGRQVAELARDSTTEQVREAIDAVHLRTLSQRLEKTARDLRLSLGEGIQRVAWSEIDRRPTVQMAWVALGEALEAIEQGLAGHADRGPGLERCHARASTLRETYVQVGEAREGAVQWVETAGLGYRLHQTPLEIGPELGPRLLQAASSWIFTSATLAVGDSFDHFTSEMGLADPQMVRWTSPFDFEHQSLLYCPPGLPDPNDLMYTHELLTVILPVLEASGGRAFLLFTSHRALREAAGWLDGRIHHPLLVQGQAPRATLLAEFRERGDAVLLGTSSFWEGVDVRGEALSCVIIDRLPFGSPGDPLVRARADAMRGQGQDPFMHSQLPRAVIALKQGVGRLIRDPTDRGVLVLADPRLHTRRYGRLFLDSLPPMPLSRDVGDVEAFFAEETA